MMFNPMMMLQQMMANMQNPQQLVSRFLPNIPVEIRNDPNQIISWMQQNGMVTHEQIQRARQMMGQQVTGK